MSSECISTPKLLRFTEKELSLVQLDAIPRHVALMMDGNRRWARRNSKIPNPLSGHWAGAKVLNTIIEAARDLGVEVLTVYGLSTENLSRPVTEVETLFTIIETYLRENRDKMVQQGVRFSVIGDMAPLPRPIKEEIARSRIATRHCSNIDLVVALNYGARDELRRAICSLTDDVLARKVKKEEITENLISRYLDTAHFGDPDLLIRPSGERRISNFLLWQLAYTEIYITDTLWPDFTPRDLLDAVLDFQKRQRRRGR